MPRVDVPFVGGAYKGRSVNQNPQECVNFFLETDQEGGKEPIALYGTPGCLLYLDSKLWVPGGVTPVPTPTPAPGTRWEYLDSSHTIVKDNLTGLVWQYYDVYNRPDYTDMTLPKAIAYAQESVYGGYSDWRVPRMDELATILDYTRRPASYVELDNVPEGASYFLLWTSSVMPNGLACAVDLALGHNFIYPAGNTMGVRLVRGGPFWGAPSTRLSSNTASTVVDSYNGLIWQQVDDGAAKTYSQAVAYAAALSLDGYTSWRLPTITELLTIVDYGYATAISPILTATAGKYWSSTALLDNPGWVWYQDFGPPNLPETSFLPDTVSNYVRCVSDV